MLNNVTYFFFQNSAIIWWNLNDDGKPNTKTVQRDCPVIIGAKWGESQFKQLDLNNVKLHLSYDVASGSEITPCIKIDKPLVVYRFTENVMTSITTLRT